MLKKISFCGLSHLGLVYTSVYSNFSKKIVCYDENEILINDLSKKKIDINEPNLNKELNKNFKKITFTNEINDIAKSDLIFISLDVPTDLKGNSNYNKIFNILKLIKKNKLNNSPVIILSQLYPGFCDELIKKFNNPIYYQVETLVFGEAIKRASFPERIIIGSKNKKIENKSYKYLLNKFDCPIINMNFKTAEMTKICINIFLISTAMTANFLSILSEKINYDWSLVAKSLRLDKRIGKYAYLNPSLGLSGGNLERDLKTLEKISKKKIDISIINSWKKISNLRKFWISSILSKLLKTQSIKTISLLGLSYKINTNSIKNSNATFTSQQFKGIFFLGYDPVVKSKQIEKFKNIKNFLKNDNKIIALNRNSIDFLFDNSSNKLQKIVRDNDIIVNSIAIAPCKNIKDLNKNIIIINNIQNSLKNKKISKYINISSDAVYPDLKKKINEKTAPNPNSIHGLMHLNREMLINASLNCKIIHIRPTLIYGYGDPHGGYGPNLFYKTMIKNNTITLFGNGEEIRDHIYIKDLTYIISKIIFKNYTGIINLVTGQGITFMKIAQEFKKLNKNINIITTRRNQKMPHNGYRLFNNTNIKKLFPNLKFKSFSNNLKQIVQEYNEKNKSS